VLIQIACACTNQHDLFPFLGRKGPRAAESGNTFDLWGRRTTVSGTSSTSIGFTGHRSYSAGSGWLTHYRFLDPDLGRWLNQDPDRLIDGPNLYTYVGNNPVRAIDPDGRATEVLVLPWIMTPPGAIVTTAAAVVVAIMTYDSSEQCRREECRDKWIEENTFCETRYPKGSRAYYMCKNRAMNRYFACLDKLPMPGPLDPIEWPE